jgi:creatinine amidohydrolase
VIGGRRLGSLRWPEVAAGSLLAVPLGSCEQHGPHLPLDTDTRIAVAFAELLAGSADDVVVAPPVSVGASGEHQSFPGTLSIGTVALEALLVELVRSALPPVGSPAPAPFRGVVLVNGHGGNVEATGRAAALLASEGRAVLVWHPSVPGGDSHAGRTETSMLLHLSPDVVRMERAEPGATARWRDLRDTVVADGLAAVSPNGVLGDPTGATAAEGAVIVAQLAADLAAAVDRWRESLSVVERVTSEQLGNRP